MSITEAPETRTVSPSGAPAPADVFVVFGITGDLAKVMTFHSLYRLEQRGLLDCPIVGVAVDDWTVDRSREACARVDRGAPASSSTRRSSSASPRGSPTSRATSPTPSPTSASRTRIGGREDAGLLPRDPAVPVRPGRARGWREAGLTKTARVVVEKPFGHDLASARALADELHQYIDESQLSGSTTSSGRWASRRSSTCGSRTRCSSRSGTANTSSPSRSRWRRTSASRTAATSTTRSARCATSSSTTSCRSWARRRWSRRPGGDPQTLKDAQGRALSRGQDGRPGALRARPVRGLPRDRRRRTRLDHRDVRGAAARHRQLALVGRPVLHPHRQAAAGDADRAPARLQAPAASRLRAARAVGPSRTSSWSSSTPRPGSGSSSTPVARTAAARADRAGHGVRRGGRRGRRRRTRSCCTPRWSATAPGSPARTASRRRGGSCSRCSTRPHPSTPTRPGSWGPEAADELLAGHGRWHEPWIVS